MSRLLPVPAFAVGHCAGVVPAPISMARLVPSVGLCSATGQAGTGAVPVKRSLSGPMAVGHGACPWAADCWCLLPYKITAGCTWASNGYRKELLLPSNLPMLQCLRWTLDGCTVLCSICSVCFKEDYMVPKIFHWSAFPTKSHVTQHVLFLLPGAVFGGERSND